jgi:autotransporter-associated beta strand protein
VRDGTLNAAGFTLTKIGTNIVSLANLGESNLGNLVINTGRIAFEGNTTFGSQPGTVLVASTGELGFESSTAVQTKAIQLNGGKVVFNTGTANESSGPVALAATGANTFQGPVSHVSALLTLSGDVSGPGTLTKTQLGALVLSGTNSYTGGTAINGGGVIFTSTAAVPTTGTIALGSNSAVGFGFDFDHAFLTARVSATPNPATIALGTSSANSYNFASYSGASLGAYTNATYSATLTPYNTSTGGTYRFGGGEGTLTVSSVLSGNNALSIGSGGSGGTVILTGANTHVGATTIATGSTVILGSPTALGDTSNGLTNSGLLDLNGYDLTVGSLTAAQNVATIIITDNSSTPGTTILRDNIVSGSTTYGSRIEDGINGRKIALVKDGAGTLILNGNSAVRHTGGTTIAGGSLQIRTNQVQVLPVGGDITFSGTGNFNLANNGNAAVTLTLGNLAFTGGEGTVQSNNFNSGTGSQNTIFAAAPTRAAGATANFILTNTSSPSTYRVSFTTAPTLGQSINGGVFFAGDTFAAYDAAGYVRSLNYTTDTNGFDVPLTEDVATIGFAATGKDVQLGGSSFKVTDQTSDTIRSLCIARGQTISRSPRAPRLPFRAVA